MPLIKHSVEFLEKKKQKEEILRKSVQKELRTLRELRIVAANRPIEYSFSLTSLKLMDKIIIQLRRNPKDLNRLLGINDWRKLFREISDMHTEVKNAIRLYEAIRNKEKLG